MFIDRLDKLLRDNKFNAKSFCEQTGIAPASVTKWRNGTLPKAEMLERIADFFNVSTDYLLGRTEEQSINLQNSIMSKEDSELLELIKKLSLVERAKVIIEINNIINRNNS